MNQTIDELDDYGLNQLFKIETPVIDAAWAKRLVKHEKIYKLYDNVDEEQRFILNAKVEYYIAPRTTRPRPFFKYYFFHCMGEEFVLDASNCRLLEMPNDQDVFNEQVVLKNLKDDEDQFFEESLIYDDVMEPVFDNIDVFTTYEKNQKDIKELRLVFKLKNYNVTAICKSYRRYINVMGINANGKGCMISEEHVEILKELNFKEKLVKTIENRETLTECAMKQPLEEDSDLENEFEEMLSLL